VTCVRFFRADGTLDKEVEAAPGERLLDVAWAERQPLEGACEGVMACSTCHVIVDKADFEKLPRASDEEEDLLDLASHATRTSRLSCQIILTDDMGTLDVRIPAGSWLAAAPWSTQSRASISPVSKAGAIGGSDAPSR